MTDESFFLQTWTMGASFFFGALSFAKAGTEAKDKALAANNAAVLFFIQTPK
uniref:hypothetical protein n=1 Tax=Escherichia coli TaxID=562 RepID=UPI003D817D66